MRFRRVCFVVGELGDDELVMVEVCDFADVTYGVSICYMCSSFLLCKHGQSATMFYVCMAQRDCSNVAYVFL